MEEDRKPEVDWDAFRAMVRKVLRYKPQKRASASREEPKADLSAEEEGEPPRSDSN